MDPGDIMYLLIPFAVVVRLVLSIVERLGECGSDMLEHLEVLMPMAEIIGLSSEPLRKAPERWPSMTTTVDVGVVIKATQLSDDLRCTL